MPTVQNEFDRWRHVVVLAGLVACYLFGASPAIAAGKQASFVIDANTGKVISAYDADEPRHPASLTKMMTLYLAFEQIERGRLSYDTRIAVSAHAASAQPTKLDMMPGDEITVLDAVKAMVTQSANDAAIAIAEHIGGSEDNFAAMMTRKARTIGMLHTTFKNASGLPNAEQFTTAHDMVTLGLRLHDEFPQHYQWFALREFAYNGHQYRNHNTMLDSYEGTEGIKTGYTAASGFNLVASVKRGDRHVIGAVFGGATAGSRNATMRTLLNMALFKSSPIKTRTPLVATARQPRAPDPTPAARPSTATAATTARPTATPVVAVAPAPPHPIEIARVHPVLVQASTPPQQPQPQQQTQVRVATAGAIAPSMPATSARGAPPSTLQRQAMSLSLQASSPNRLASPPAPPRTEIQIGAYASEQEAQRQLTLTRGKAADLVGNASTRTEQVAANGRALWRARFGGFDATAAGQICTELRRRQIDCLVARAE